MLLLYILFCIFYFVFIWRSIWPWVWARLLLATIGFVLSRMINISTFLLYYLFILLLTIITVCKKIYWNSRKYNTWIIKSCIICKVRLIYILYITKLCFIIVLSCLLPKNEKRNYFPVYTIYIIYSLMYIYTQYTILYKCI